MGKTYLIDTNIILEYTGGLLPIKTNNLVGNFINNSGLRVSVINQIEVLGHPSATKELNGFFDTAKIYQLTQKIIIQTIELRKIKKIKLPDAIIAATAITHNLTLISRNIKDFKNVPGLEVIDPYSL